MKKNTGVRIQKPLATDFIAGGETGIDYKEILSNGDWTSYLPSPERQSGKFVDSMACVSFSALNSLEAQIERMRATTLSESNENWLKNNGYIGEDGKCNFSDRFTAKMSGTTKSGNYLGAVWDSIRNHGVLPEKDWKLNLDKLDWNSFYTEIPQELKTKASKFLEIFETKYEWVIGVENIEIHLKQAPIQIVSKVCTPWATTDIIPSCGAGSQHATLLYNRSADHYNIFDHYEPFNKRVALDFSIPYMMKGVVTLKKPVESPQTFKYSFTTKLALWQSGEGVKALQTALQIDGVFPKSVNITGFYGRITQQAVLAFTKKYKIASPQDIAYVNGRWVGPATRAKLNELFCKG